MSHDEPVILGKHKQYSKISIKAEHSLKEYISPATDLDLNHFVMKNDGDIAVLIKPYSFMRHTEIF